METLLLLDGKNYDPSLPEIRRTGVRGIIFENEKLLMIRTNFGDVKFPGGGQEEGENDETTLIRETLEETGFQVIPESIRPFGEVVEKRLSLHEPMIWHQINRYYFCRITGSPQDTQFSENEQRYGMHPIWCTLEEAIAANRAMLEREGRTPWNQREFRVLELLREKMASEER